MRILIRKAVFLQNIQHSEVRLKKVMQCSFVTPEYNRSISGALKNALDVGSRPYGQSAWDGKPAAVISQSIRWKFKWICANHHLRQSLVVSKYAELSNNRKDT